MTLHFKYHPRLKSGNNQSVGSWVLVVSRWLWPGNRTFLEVASMVVTWWIVAFVRNESHLESKRHTHQLEQVRAALATQIHFFIPNRPSSPYGQRQHGYKRLFGSFTHNWFCKSNQIPFNVASAHLSTATYSTTHVCFKSQISVEHFTNIIWSMAFEQIQEW